MSFLDDIVNLAATTITTANITDEDHAISKESYYVFLYFGALMIICIIMLIYIFLKVPECR